MTLKWAPQSSGLNQLEHTWEVVEPEIHIVGVICRNCDSDHVKTSQGNGVQPGNSHVSLIMWCMSEPECLFS